MGQFKTVIIGFGHAGRDLHLKCIRKLQIKNRLKLRLDRKVIAVDPKFSSIDTYKTDMFDLTLLNDVKEIDGLNPINAVVHICTPPNQRSAIVKDILEIGFKNVIIEKPIASSLLELHEIKKLQSLYDARILVVGNIISSRLTKKILGMLNSGDHGHISTITMIQNKPRFSLSLEKIGSENIFDIELPHQVSLVQHLLSTKIDPVHIYVKDMHASNQKVPDMGSAKLTLKSENGVLIELISNLESPIRERKIVLLFKNGESIVGFFPISGDDQYSQIELYDTNRCLVYKDKFVDDPLTCCFEEYYDYFQSEKPGNITHTVKVEYQEKVIELMERAKHDWYLGLDSFKNLRN